MKKICLNCQYQREAGQMDTEIPGAGQWCSNSQSPRFRTRVKDDDSCDKFTQRGKKAGIGLRLKVKGLGVVNKWMKKGK